MLSAILAVVMWGVAPASSPAAGGPDDQLWATYIAPGAQPPAGAQVVLVERVPLVKAAEGYPPAFAALGSVLDYNFPPPIIAFTYAAPAIGAAAAKHVANLLGPAQTQKELDRIAVSLSRGKLREIVEPLMGPYKQAASQADLLRRKDRNVLLSMGQIRMTFLRVSAASKRDPNSLEDALAGNRGHLSNSRR